jgi:hypothetical protein
MRLLLTCLFLVSSVYATEVKKEKHHNPITPPNYPAPLYEPIKTEIVTKEGREVVKFSFEDHTYILFHNPFASLGNDFYMHDPNCEKCAFVMPEPEPKKKK